MAESVELTDVGDSSESEDLLHLIRKICPPVTGESENSYKVFCHFALTEPSVTKLANDQGIDLEVLKIWAEDFDWVERVKEWKSIYRAHERRQWQIREKAIMERWNDRREQFLQVADELLAKV